LLFLVRGQKADKHLGCNYYSSILCAFQARRFTIAQSAASLSSKSLNLCGELFRTWHPGTLNKDWNNKDIPMQRRRSFDLHEVLWVVESSPSFLINRVDV
jgi:hypothetical protein